MGNKLVYSGKNHWELLKVIRNQEEPELDFNKNQVVISFLVHRDIRYFQELLFISNDSPSSLLASEDFQWFWWTAEN